MKTTASSAATNYAVRLPRLLTLAETADVLRVSTKTVRRLIAADKLASQRVGNRIRITEADLRVYLARG
jgi:excisionase family DNA binding protein